MARRKKHGFRNFTLLCLFGFGVWVYVTQPRRDFDNKLDKAVRVYQTKKDEARQKAKEELQGILDSTLGK
jgi:hypothetical protein